MTIVAAIAGWIGGSILSAELLGYWLHRLLHTGAIGFLSRSHMKHHLILYGPLQEQRSVKYHDATNQRVSLGNIGTEWIIPAATLMALSAGVFYFFQVRWLYAWTYFTVTVTWSLLMFSKLHDVMHVENFWLQRSRLLRGWFLSARRRHDLHHFSLDNQGLMNKNFGIGFYFFDRVFGTLLDSSASFNQRGYEAACERFQSLVGVESAVSKEKTYE